MTKDAVEHLNKAREELDCARDIFRDAHKKVPVALRLAINAARVATDMMIRDRPK